MHCTCVIIVLVIELFHCVCTNESIVIVVIYIYIYIYQFKTDLDDFGKNRNPKGDKTNNGGNSISAVNLPQMPSKLFQWLINEAVIYIINVALLTTYFESIFYKSFDYML